MDLCFLDYNMRYQLSAFNYIFKSVANFHLLAQKVSFLAKYFHFLCSSDLFLGYWRVNIVWYTVELLNLYFGSFEILDIFWCLKSEKAFHPLMWVKNGQNCLNFAKAKKSNHHSVISGQWQIILHFCKKYPKVYS